MKLKWMPVVLFNGVHVAVCSDANACDRPSARSLPENLFRVLKNVVFIKLLMEEIMRKTSLAILISLLSAAGISLAAAPSTEIRESTDPSRAAAVEQRAMEIQAQQQAQQQTQTSGGQDATEETKSKKHGKRTHAKKHAAKAGKGKSAADTGASTGSSSMTPGSGSGGATDQSGGASGKSTDQSGGSSSTSTDQSGTTSGTK